MKIETSTSTRLDTSTFELDAAELKWWEKFADVEERFCWVQSPVIQKFLRAKYLRRIVELASPNARIAELGCGTGWLSILLAKIGVERVVGIDFSEAQIQKARQKALEANVAHKVEFRVVDASSLTKGLELFDVIILHGFLHHLTTIEIHRVISTAYEMLSPTGRLIIWEPVQYQSSEVTSEVRKLLRRLERIRLIPLRSQLWGLRKFSSEEQQARTLIAERVVGESARGPSPKEMPFTPDELPALLAPYFYVQERRPCMAVSHFTAQETLLMEISNPLLARLLRWPLLAMARHLERRLLSLDSPPPGIWIFEMFECLVNEERK